MNPAVQQAISPEVMSILNSAVGMACGAALTGLFAWAYHRFKKTSGLPKTVQILEGRLGRVEDAAMMILRGMGDQNIALKASLEAHKGKCNGNVEDALDVIQKSDTERRIFFEKQALTGMNRTRGKE